MIQRPLHMRDVIFSLLMQYTRPEMLQRGRQYVLVYLVQGELKRGKFDHKYTDDKEKVNEIFP